MRLEQTHDLTHVLHRCCTGNGDGFVDQRGDFFLTQRLRQELLNHLNFALFFRSQLVATGVGKLFDRVSALLHHFVQNRGDAGVIWINPLVNFDFLDFGQN